MWLEYDKPEVPVMANAVRRIRLVLLVVIGLMAVIGIFPGILLQLLGLDGAGANNDTMIMIAVYYVAVFMLFLVWMFLLVLERRMRNENG